MSKPKRRNEWWLISELVALAFLVLAVISPPDVRTPMFVLMGIAAVTGVVMVFMQGPAPLE